ncbi:MULTISPECIES: hypothetical protein [Bartonella]|uniref:Flagellar assembly protein FliH n=1 Tax=Bartonella chomelii TaxID=236402 RepID=A0ABR6E734_9HYPH|nr:MULTISPECIES: hypothetical protein [Bartonella]MBA9083445.1 hypothetical protein [Bartonella chomelii]
MEAINGMEKIGEEFKREASVSLASFLSDFSPVDEDTEILLFSDESEQICDNEKYEEFLLSSTDFVEEDMEEILPLHVASENDVDFEVVEQKTFDQVEQETTEKLQKQFAAEKQQMEEEHAKAIEVAKQGVVENLGAQMHSQLIEGFADLRQGIAKDIAQVLAAFIGEKITQEALQQFAAKMADQVIDEEQSLVLEGNEKLFEQLKKQEGFDASKFEFQSTNSTEIRLRRGNVVTATQLTPLLANLQELVQ